MKKLYSTPAVIVHGTVEEITQTLGKWNNRGKGKGKDRRNHRPKNSHDGS